MNRWAIVVVLLTSAILQSAEVKSTVKDGVVTYKHGEVLLTAYQFEGTVAVEKGEGTKPLAKPFFYPINTPSGVQVTRDWPLKRGIAGETVDHFHQKSGWFCHGDVMAEGIELKTKSADKHVKGVDFWSEASGHGRIVNAIAMERSFGNKQILVNTLEWRSPDDVLLLAEQRAIIVMVVEGGTLIDVRSVLTAKTKSVTFGDTKEGSFGARVHDELRIANNKSMVTSSDGSSVTGPKKGTLPMWGQIAAWHDYSGTVGGKPCGIAIFTDPKNKYASAWHTRDYGLMAANPFGRDKSGYPGVKGKTDLITLKAGESLDLRYAIFAHDGDVKAGKVKEAYAAFTK